MTFEHVLLPSVAGLGVCGKCDLHLAATLACDLRARKFYMFVWNCAHRCNFNMTRLGFAVEIFCIRSDCMCDGRRFVSIRLFRRRVILLHHRQVYATNSTGQVDEQRHKHAVIYASIATLIASAATATKKVGKLFVTEM